MKRLLTVAILTSATLIGPAASGYEGEYGGAGPEHILFVTGQVIGTAEAALKCKDVKTDVVMADIRTNQRDADEAIAKGGNPRTLQKNRDMAYQSSVGQCSSLRQDWDYWFPRSRAQVEESCGSLWSARNYIFKEAGYCFKTAKAIKAFGNAGCKYDRLEDVPLTPQQRQRVTSIQRQEQEEGCSK